jgi:hypothetical protein
MINSAVMLIISLVMNTSLPIVACLDISIKTALKKGRRLRFALFNAIFKLSIILFYVVTYITANYFTELPAYFRTDFHFFDLFLIMVMNGLLTFFIGTFVVPVHKSVVCSLKLLLAEELKTAPQPPSESRWGARIAAVYIDVVVQAMVLTGVFYGVIRFLGRNNPDFALSLDIGVLPLFAVVVIFGTVLFGLNFLIYKMAGGRFVGERVMCIRGFAGSSRISPPQV